MKNRIYKVVLKVHMKRARDVRYALARNRLTVFENNCNQRYGLPADGNDHCAINNYGNDLHFKCHRQGIRSYYCIIQVIVNGYDKVFSLRNYCDFYIKLALNVDRKAYVFPYPIPTFPITLSWC